MSLLVYPQYLACTWVLYLESYIALFHIVLRLSVWMGLKLGLGKIITPFVWTMKKAFVKTIKTVYLTIENVRFRFASIVLLMPSSFLKTTYVGNNWFITIYMRSDSNFLGNVLLSNNSIWHLIEIKQIKQHRRLLCDFYNSISSFIERWATIKMFHFIK